MLADLSAVPADGAEITSHHSEQIDRDAELSLGIPGEFGLMAA